MKQGWSNKEKALAPKRALLPTEKRKNPVLQDNCQQVCPSTHHLAVSAFLLHSEAGKDIFS